MAIHATEATEVTAEIDLWVPRDEMGDLESGVRAVVADVEGVRTAEVTGVSDVTPRSTDIRVTATVWMVVDGDADAGDRSAAGGGNTEAIAELLADGFAIMDVAVLVAESADA